MVESSIKQMYWEKHGVSDLPRGVGTSGQQSGDQGYNRGDHPREDPSETETWNYSWHQESRLDQGCCLRGSYGAVYLVLWFLSMGCVFLPSWAQNITFVCWSMNHPPWVSGESHDPSPREHAQVQRPTKWCWWCLGVTSYLTPRSWIWNQRPPEPGYFLMIFQMRLLHHSAAFHFPCIFFPSPC